MTMMTRAAQEFLAAYLEKAGFECKLLARDPERPNVVARLRGRSDGPVLGYLGWMQVWYGSVNFVTYSNEFMYGRIVQFAGCTGLSLPSYEVHLCPPHQAAAADPNFYMWDPLSPQVTLLPADGLSKSQIVGNFNTAIIEHQPLAWLRLLS